jgi:hypothetical protein
MQAWVVGSGVAALHFSREFLILSHEAFGRYGGTNIRGFWRPGHEISDVDEFIEERGKVA